MRNDIAIFENLIHEFVEQHITDPQPTYLELCNYPKSRREEVTSRILQFLFNPNGIHGLGTLWLNSLFNTLQKEIATTNHKNTNVITKEITDGKRIDLTIISDNYIIGIENKLNADVYNPLDIYAKCLNERYQDKEKILVLLSLKKQNSPDVIRKIQESKFINITYGQLFQHVKQNLGKYILESNSTYLTYMLDFIKTIEHMSNKNTQIENEFFFKNEQNINQLIRKYEEFKTNILNEQKEQIAILQQRISERTQTKWNIYKGWDLITDFNGPKNEVKIGIEASYQANINSECAEFHIYITTWSDEAWEIYEKEVLKSFTAPEYIKLDKTVATRVYLHLPIIYGNNHDEIINALDKAYHKLQEIAKVYKS